MSVNVWIRAARLRTLPLAVSGVITGNLIAIAETSQFNPATFVLSLTTAILLQILSNYANDYGDFKNGVDTFERSDRMLASGLISELRMKHAIQLLIIIVLISGISLLFQSTGQMNAMFFNLLLLGLAGILAAYFYTIGNNPYGYIGLGDLSVFLFFGLLSVVGTYCLQAKTLHTNCWWIGAGVGFLSTSVLNINNIRDIDSDQLKNKKTIPVIIGIRNAYTYHALLLCGAMLCFGIYVKLNYNHPLQLIYLIFIPIFIQNFRSVKKCHVVGRQAYNKQLKNMSLLTFLICLVFSLSQLINL